MALLKDVLSSVSSIQVVQYLSNVAEHDKDKIRIASMKTLVELLDIYCTDADFITLGVRK
jgi:hypothetical protein